MGRKRERVAPLTRWQYFTKTLYSDAASRAEFEYDRVIYFKSEELQRIEAGNRRIHGLLLVIPVSYTHLDVYKRQGLHRAPRRRQVRRRGL